MLVFQLGVGIVDDLVREISSCIASRLLLLVLGIGHVDEVVNV